MSATQTVSVPPTLGERLKAEREKRGISAAQAADSIHLDAWAIDALESGDYARLGPPVYVKGHLRRYADLLRLPSAALLADFDPNAAAASARPSPQEGLRMPAEEAAARAFPFRYVAVVGGLLAVAIALVWWKPWQSHDPGRVRDPGSHAQASAPAVAGRDAADAAGGRAGATSAEGGPPAAVETAPAAVVATTPAPSVATRPAAAGPAAVSAAAGAATSAGAASAGATADLGHARLKLTFATDSWVDVHDAAGRRVYAGNCRAHSVRTIAGSAPLRVHLGAAGGVQLEVNNRAVAIQPQFIVHNAADFEAGADGVLRAATARGAQPGGPPHG